MAFTRKTLDLITCDVCGAEAPLDTGADGGTVAEISARKRHDWFGYPIHTPGHVDEGRWHACPTCHHSQEFHLGKPSAELLMRKGTKPGRAWEIVSYLVDEGRIS